MTADETFDPECEILADHFLGDLLTDPPNHDPRLTEYVALRRSLAQRIQQAVEQWNETHKTALTLFRAAR